METTRYISCQQCGRPSAGVSAPENETGICVECAQPKTADAIHALLLAECLRAELPKFYKDDVIVHDVTGLRETQTQRFVWMIRECGSHLIPLDTPDPSVNLSTSSYAHAVLHTYQGYADAKWYLYEHGKLTASTFLDARKVISGY